MILNRGVLARRAALVVLAAWIVTGALCGCAAVKPWERAILSDYLMRVDRDPLTDALSEHVYFTREAATGGRSVGGGGCGCN